MLRRKGDPGADRDRAHLTEVERADALDDRLGRRESLVAPVAGQQKGELVTSQAERLAGLAEPGGDAREDRIARAMTEPVVDPLEVVLVDDAKAERPAEMAEPLPTPPETASSDR